MDAKDKQSASACPVDHTTRAVWLDKAAAAASKSPSALSSPPKQPPGKDSNSLPTNRAISSIPRASLSESPNSPSNSEHPSVSSSTGNWIYPSEKMFFEAMRRKHYSPRSEDMKTIVPIHNAVNERAWKEIQEWEKGWGSEQCGGPKLRSFSGQSKAMTPRARWNTVLGYTAPFDRHDWVIDRCGKQVEYVIDFYSGAPRSGAAHTGKNGEGMKGLSFYLDVRPKVNSWEGLKMRVARGLGFA